MADKLGDARRSLVRAREAAKNRLEELDNERCEIKASLKSLEAALRALGQPNRRRATSWTVDDDDDGSSGGGEEEDSRAAIDTS